MEFLSFSKLDKHKAVICACNVKIPIFCQSLGRMYDTEWCSWAPPYATATADSYLTVDVALPHQSVEMRCELERYLGGPIMTVPLNKALNLELLLGGWACVEAFLCATLFYLKKKTKHSGKGECMQEWYTRNK